MAHNEILAKVVSNKMDKSVVVTTERQVRDDVYGKLQKRTSRFMAHDEKNECRIGDLVQTVVMKPDYRGYEYRVLPPTDRTVSSGATPFSVGWDNVEQIGYREDYRPVSNVLYVLGDGSGDSRNLTTVTRADSVSTHFRREGTFDGRNATTTAQREDLGGIATPSDIEILPSLPKTRSGKIVRRALKAKAFHQRPLPLGEGAARLNQPHSRHLFSHPGEHPQQILHPLPRHARTNMQQIIPGFPRPGGLELIANTVGRMNHSFHRPNTHAGKPVPKRPGGTKNNPRAAKA